MCKFCGSAGHNPIADIEASMKKVQCTQCCTESKQLGEGLYYCYQCSEYTYHDIC